MNVPSSRRFSANPPDSISVHPSLSPSPTQKEFYPAGKKTRKIPKALESLTPFGSLSSVKSQVATSRWTQTGTHSQQRSPYRFNFFWVSGKRTFLLARLALETLTSSFPPGASLQHWVPSW